MVLERYILRLGILSMGKMPVLWSMAALKRIHPIPQSPLLSPYLEKVCDGSNLDSPAGPLCSRECSDERQRRLEPGSHRQGTSGDTRSRNKDTLSQGLRREPAPLFQTAGLQNSETIYFYCFKLRVNQDRTLTSICFQLAGEMTLSW